MHYFEYIELHTTQTENYNMKYVLVTNSIKLFTNNIYQKNYRMLYDYSHFSDRVTLLV